MDRWKIGAAEKGAAPVTKSLLKKLRIYPGYPRKCQTYLID